MSETQTPATLEERRKELERMLKEWEEDAEVFQRSLSDIALDAVTGDEEAAQEAHELFEDLEYVQRCAKLARMALDVLKGGEG